MATVQKKPSKGKGFRIGRYNGYVVVGGILAAVVLGLYFRHKTSTASAQTQAGTQGTTAQDPSGGAGSSAAQPQDLTPVSDLATALNGLTGILGGNGGILGAGADPFSSSFGPGFDSSMFGGGPTFDSGLTGTDTSTGPAYTAPVGTGVVGTAGSAGGSSKGGVSFSPFGAWGAHGPSTIHPPAVIPAATQHFGAAATRQTAAAHAAGKTPAFGGVTSTKKLAGGSTLTTYANGRQVQQAPGKSAYVVKKGRP